MIQEIVYGGYSANPSDYDSRDGELALSLNLIHEDGSLKPIFKPKTLFSLGEGETLICIHKTAKFAHYIFRNAQNLICWMGDDGNKMLISAWPARRVTDSACLGNIVCVTTDNGIRYYQWTTDDGGVSRYVPLSPNLPELKMSFGLQGTIIRSEGSPITEIDRDEWDSGSQTITSQEKIKQVTDTVHGEINKFISEEVTGKGKFCYPFFVRYAYRLFDGTLTMHSAPILMLPNNDGKPAVHATTGTNHRPNGVFVTTCACKMDACVVSGLSNVVSYKDIIKSVDIFVSSPFLGYDTDGEIKQFGSILRDGRYGYYGVNGDRYARRIYKDEVEPVAMVSVSSYTWELPKRKTSTIHNDIASNASFYLVKSIPVDELPTTRIDLDIEPYKLATLTAQESMTDDYDSHERTDASGVYEYNSRLMFTGIKKTVFSGYYNQHYDNVLLSTLSRGGLYTVKRVLTYIKRDGRIVVLSEELDRQYSKISVGASPTSIIQFAYHPDPNAFKMELYLDDTSGRPCMLTLPMKPHDTLMGSYYYDDMRAQTTEVAPSDDQQVSNDLTIALPNKIYVSEIENPYYFPAQSIVSVGSGSVIGVATAAQALSQGQFGSFPLYAFTTDGVWALTTSNTGSFVAVQPITRDVCVNADSITQLDGAVLFATTRGIMMLSGSSAKCVSDSINSESPFDVTTLPQFGRLHEMIGHGEDTCIPTQSFSAYLDGCKMLYDYIHQRVVVYNPTARWFSERQYTYAYVLSLKSGAWGMIYTDIVRGVNSYPDAVAQTSDGRVVTLSSTDEAESEGLFVTRPIKFGKAGIFKSVHSVLQRGYFRPAHAEGGALVRCDVCTAVYGSRDLYNWFLLGSSVDQHIRRLHGTPYKYFRIAGITKFDNGKSLSGATVDVEKRDEDIEH